MVVLEVYKRSINVRYKSTLISKATFLTFVCGVLTYTLPFIFAYRSGGFWLKTDSFYEQPTVNLLGDYLLIATNDNSSNPIVCSTYPFYKRHLNHLDVCSLIKLREVDGDLDGKVDQIIVNFRLNIFKYKINAINLILPLKYQLNDVCPLLMQSAIIYQHYFHQRGGTDLKILADLMVHQTNPIYCDKNVINNIYNASLIDVDDDSKESQTFELDNIIEKYLERNITTHLTNIYTNVRSENNELFNLKLSVRYPQHRIYYKPGFWHIIKAAWIQYSAVYTIIAWGLIKIKNYFFRNKLVFYYEDSPFKKNM